MLIYLASDKPCLIMLYGQTSFRQQILWLHDLNLEVLSVTVWLRVAPGIRAPVISAVGIFFNAFRRSVGPRFETITFSTTSGCSIVIHVAENRHCHQPCIENYNETGRFINNQALIKEKGISNTLVFGLIKILSSYYI